MLGTVSRVMSAVVMAFTAPLLAAVPVMDQAPGQPPVEQIQTSQSIGPVDQQGPTGGQFGPQNFGGQPQQFGGPAGQPGSMMGGQFQGGGDQNSGSPEGQSGNRPFMMGRPQGSQNRQPFQPGNGQFFGGQKNFSGQPQQFNGPEGQQGGDSGGQNNQGQRGSRPFMMGRPQSSQGGQPFQGGGDQNFSNPDSQSQEAGGSDENGQGGQQQDQQKQFDTQQLKMAQGRTAGLEKGLANIKKLMTKVKNAGVTIASTDETLVSDVSGAIETIKSATDYSDDVQTAIQTIQDDTQDLQDFGQRLNQLSQWPKTLTNINKQIARLRKNFDTAKTKAAKSGIDTKSIESKIESAIAAIESARDAASADVSKPDTDMQDVMGNIQQDVFAPMNDVYSNIAVLKNLSNISLELKKMETKLKNFGIQAADLKSSGKDTSHLEELIKEAGQKRDDVKAIMAKSDIDPKELYQATSAGQGLLNSIMSEFSKLQNSGSDSGQSGFGDQSQQN
ncbi:MAG: hypothetical protein HY226_06735 [Candidatus Vogelbacteria bacterium]|nr:hypothetical protein [Candidatus Vogelbacteria bacterium]